ncbi:MAG TPA: ABC transporter ATP-binding protein [Pyrinomonadaceae bacterium]|nr:ABC transporter ATP-binding protein [Pyrinomonadaceae bacterium]
MSPIIKVENLGKQYRIGAAQASYATLRDSLVGTVRAPFRRWRRRGAENSSETFWAIKDVNFEIAPGEVVGVIGRNGAGKSTLLKMLSRITEPTTGGIDLYGRIASLLEVGTGFHPELTGRENIFLNGAILGMRKTEIAARFDEIVAFSEVDKFIDTPVKHYSSGMYVRLAFAVAAHLEPEILIIDEVLSVGDAAFQKKCMGKMSSVARQGRTVLFVSHNMGAVVQLCSRAIILKQGECILDTDAPTAVSRYLNESERLTSAATFADEPDKDVQILSVSLTSAQGESISVHPHTDAFCLTIDYRVTEWKSGSYVCVDVFNENDVRLLWSSDVRSVDEMVEQRAPGAYRARVTIPGGVLSPGFYYFTSAIFAPGRGTAFDVKDKSVSLEIADAGSLLSNFGIRPHAATMIPLGWETSRLN